MHSSLPDGGSKQRDSRRGFGLAILCLLGIVMGIYCFTLPKTGRTRRSPGICSAMRGRAALTREVTSSGLPPGADEIARNTVSRPLE